MSSRPVIATAQEAIAAGDLIEIDARTGKARRYRTSQRNGTGCTCGAGDGALVHQHGCNHIGWEPPPRSPSRESAA